MSEMKNELARLREVLRAAKAIVDMCEEARQQKRNVLIPVDRYGWLVDAVKEAEAAATSLTASDTTSTHGG